MKARMHGQAGGHTHTQNCCLGSKRSWTAGTNIFET